MVRFGPTSGEFNAFDQCSLATCLIQDDLLVHANRRFLTILGHVSLVGMIGTPPMDWVVADDRVRFGDNVRWLLTRESPSFTMMISGHRSDGAPIRAEANAVLATHAGRPAISIFLEDVAARHLAEEDVRRHTAQMRVAISDTIGMAMRIGELRDPYTASHQRRVAQFSVALGAEMGFDLDRQEGLRVAGYLHDIGKMMIPMEIINKPEKLTNIEYLLIQRHAQASFDVLKGISFPWPVAEVGLQHHERIDGSGYPNGLIDGEILTDALVVAVADVVDAMLSQRPYRSPIDIDGSLAIIKAEAGVSLDADVADACLRIFSSHRHEALAVVNCA